MGRSWILATAGALLAIVFVAAPVAAGPIVGEWDPGLTEAEVGGPIVVDDYGVNGLGLYRVQLDDGTTRAAVCVQADVGHSLGADYVVEAGAPFAAELGYLAWAYLADEPPSDVVAAAVNVLAWRYTDAQRRTGGPVWQGEDVEVRALGVGRLVDVEQAVGALHAEATARRGPWAFAEPVVADGTATVGVAGPSGPIAGVAVTFAAGEWSTVAVTGPDGRAVAEVPADAMAVEVSAQAPGEAVGLVAEASQRLAMAGPPVLLRAAALAPPTTSTTTTTTVPPTTTEALPPPTTTSTTTTTTTTTTTSTTVPPTTTTTSTSTAPTTSTTTTVPATSTSVPATTVASPPTLPRTGRGARGPVRIGSLLFALGAGAVLVAAPRRRVR
ncbi:MAG: hypothetical protein ABW195_00085 [Ilumatobacteraceae bacterium]